MGGLWTAHGPLVAFGTGAAFALIAAAWFLATLPHSAVTKST
jgi:hypothetical protein